MKKIFELSQNLQNLNRIKRQGGNLALGLPDFMNISIAEHSYTATYLAMFFVDTLKEKNNLNTEKILRFCLTHDWAKVIVGDIPSSSPSFASFWDINIKDETKKTSNKAFQKILDFISEEIDPALYRFDFIDQEKLIIKSADLTAYLLEMQEWKYLGFCHDGWEMIWFNTIALLEKINLPYIPDLVKEIKGTYQIKSKRPSPFLAQIQKQINPHHQL